MAAYTTAPKMLARPPSPTSACQPVMMLGISSSHAPKNTTYVASMDTVATSRRKKRSFSVGWKIQPHPAPPSQMAPKVSQGVASWVKQAYSRKIEPAENPKQVTTLRS